MKNNYKCDMTLHSCGCYNTTYSCNKPAKWKSPSKINGRIYNLCGTHKNQVDLAYKKQGKNLKCLEIK